MVPAACRGDTNTHQLVYVLSTKKMTLIMMKMKKAYEKAYEKACEKGV